MTSKCLSNYSVKDNQRVNSEAWACARRIASAKRPSVEAARVLNLRYYTISGSHISAASCAKPNLSGRLSMEINGVCLVCSQVSFLCGMAGMAGMAGMVQKLQTPQGHHGGFVTPQASEQVMGVVKLGWGWQMVARAISQNIFWLRYLGDLGERPEREQVRVVFYLGPHQHYEYQHHRSVNVIMNKSSKRQSGRWMSVDVGGCWFQSSYAQEVALLLRSSHNIFETNRQFFRKKKKQTPGLTFLP